MFSKTKKKKKKIKKIKIKNVKKGLMKMKITHHHTETKHQRKALPAKKKQKCKQQSDFNKVKGNSHTMMMKY